MHAIYTLGLTAGVAAASVLIKSYCRRAVRQSQSASGEKQNQAAKNEK